MAPTLRISLYQSGDVACTGTYESEVDFSVGTCGPGNPGNTNGFSTSSLGGGVSENALWSGYFRLNVYDRHFQDDVKLSPRLMMNAGVRWEDDGNFYSGQGLESSLWPNLAAQVPLPGSSPQTGSLAGFVVPMNYPGPVATGLYVNSNDSRA